MIRAIIADDERIARLRVRDLLSAHSWITCIGETSDAQATVRQTNQDMPDLLFLDIQMPGMLGTSLVHELHVRPVIVFTTAYDQYAVDAFGLDAVDYLMKPLTQQRFGEAMQRVQRALTLTGVNPDHGAKHTPPQRLFIRRYTTIQPVLVSDIIRIEAKRDYVALHTRRGRHVARMTMRYLESILDPTRFLRVHRAHFINLNHVDVMRPFDRNRLRIRMSDGSEITASRSQSRFLRSMSR